MSLERCKCGGRVGWMMVMRRGLCSGAGLLWLEIESSNWDEG